MRKCYYVTASWPTIKHQHDGYSLDVNQCRLASLSSLCAQRVLLWPVRHVTGTAVHAIVLPRPSGRNTRQDAAM